ncbi:DnaD domain-containing protein [uncultured Limosilactobacillus sp.]|uniref:DnaD domain-containing protein n=1 Tax=uncultured Limosilactobacillus sp. TaxID=2837629 RepID=UPI0025F9555C|nr:DnaD domain protein [uncultured Limosilactobacillus sp.]
MDSQSFMEQYVTAGSTVISNLLLHHYHEIGMSTAELMVYIELRSYIDRGQSDPAVTQIAKHLGTSEDQVYDLINQMIKDRLMVQKMVKSADGKESMQYDFAPLLNKLRRLIEHQTTATNHQQSKNQRQKLFAALETEFGRLLNPIEMSLVNDWLDQDHYDIEVIKLALRETVLNGKYNFKYMDRILSNWARQNLKTPQAVKAAQKQFDEQHHYTSSNSEKQNHPTGKKIPIFQIDPADSDKS